MHEKRCNAMLTIPSSPPMPCSPMDFKWAAHTNLLVLIFWFKLRRFTVCRKDAITSANNSDATDACTCKCNAKAMCHMRRHRISCKGVNVQYELNLVMSGLVRTDSAEHAPCCLTLPEAGTYLGCQKDSAVYVWKFDLQDMLGF